MVKSLYPTPPAFKVSNMGDPVEFSQCCVVLRKLECWCYQVVKEFRR